MPRKFSDPRHQDAYDRVRAEGVPRLGASIYWAYRNGLHGNPCRAIKGSAAYVWWSAGHDNFVAKTPGKMDRSTFERLDDLPGWMTLKGA